MNDGGIRVGKVSSVDYKNGMIKVVYNDKGRSVTADLPYANFNNEYNMPEIESAVLVAHLANGSSRGVVLGNMWNKKNSPQEHGSGLYRKDLSRQKGAALYRYEDATGEYLLKAPNIKLIAINEMEIAGPKIIIDATDSIEVETQEALVNIPKISLSGGKDGKIEITNQADITFLSEENKCDATVKGSKIEIMETFDLVSTEDATVESKQNISLIAATDIKLEDATFRTTLSKILERLEALDGDPSARK